MCDSLFDGLNVSVSTLIALETHQRQTIGRQRTLIAMEYGLSEEDVRINKNEHGYYLYAYIPEEMAEKRWCIKEK